MLGVDRSKAFSYGATEMGTEMMFEKACCLASDIRDIPPKKRRK